MHFELLLKFQVQFFSFYRDLFAFLDNAFQFSVSSLRLHYN